MTNETEQLITVTNTTNDFVANRTTTNIEVELSPEKLTEFTNNLVNKIKHKENLT